MYAHLGLHAPMYQCAYLYLMQPFHRHTMYPGIGSSNIEDLRKVIGGERLDFLLYTDVGMDATTYALAHSR